VSARGGLLVATFWWVAIGYIVASFAPGFWTLAILLAVAGMGDAAWHPIATGVLTQNSPKRRAHVLGLHAIGGTMAEVLAPLSVGFLLAWFDWQQVLQLSVLPAMLAGVAFFWISRHVPRSRATAISLGDMGALWRIWQSVKGAKLIGADLGADMRNQSMGLMRGILKSADLEGADLSKANLSRVDLEFASLKNANLSGANLMSAQLGGADLTGAAINNANFNKADVTSAHLKALKGAEAANLERSLNLNRAFRD